MSSALLKLLESSGLDFMKGATSRNFCVSPDVISFSISTVGSPEPRISFTLF